MWFITTWLYWRRQTLTIPQVAFSPPYVRCVSPALPRIHQQAGFSQEPKHECLISGSCCEMCASLTATYQLHLWVWISLYDHYYMHACLIFQALLLRGKYLNSLNSFKKHVVAFDVVEYMIEYATYSICYLFLKHFLY